MNKNWIRSYHGTWVNLDRVQCIYVSKMPAQKKSIYRVCALISPEAYECSGENTVFLHSFDTNEDAQGYLDNLMETL